MKPSTRTAFALLALAGAALVTTGCAQSSTSAYANPATTRVVSMSDLDLGTASGDNIGLAIAQPRQSQFINAPQIPQTASVPTR